MTEDDLCELKEDYGFGRETPKTLLARDVHELLAEVERLQAEATEFREWAWEKILHGGPCVEENWFNEVCAELQHQEDLRKQLRAEVEALRAEVSRFRDWWKSLRSAES